MPGAVVRLVRMTTTCMSSDIPIAEVLKDFVLAQVRVNHNFFEMLVRQVMMELPSLMEKCDQHVQIHFLSSDRIVDGGGLVDADHDFFAPGASQLFSLRMRSNLMLRRTKQVKTNRA